MNKTHGAFSICIKKETGKSPQELMLPAYDGLASGEVSRSHAHVACSFACENRASSVVAAYSADMSVLPYTSLHQKKYQNQHQW